MTRVLIFIIAGATAMGAWPADEFAVGERTAAKYRCATCHGRAGISFDPRYPNIAGQQEIYLESRLRSFRAGEYPASKMTQQSEPLSDQDIQNLAAYYSRLSKP